jgi:hypothetical protein
MATAAMLCCGRRLLDASDCNKRWFLMLSMKVHWTTVSKANSASFVGAGIPGVTPTPHCSCL